MQPIRITPAHRMLASAVLVGVVIVGGASVTAAAFAGRLDKVTTVGDAPAAGPASSEVPPAGPGTAGFTGPLPSSEADPDVVSKLLTDDPGEVAGYWTTERLKDADPMPMPEVSINIVTPGD